jgi:hypothetical protein
MSEGSSAEMETLLGARNRNGWDWPGTGAVSHVISARDCGVSSRLAMIPAARLSPTQATCAARASVSSSTPPGHHDPRAYGVPMLGYHRALARHRALRPQSGTRGHTRLIRSGGTLRGFGRHGPRVRRGPRWARRHRLATMIRESLRCRDAGQRVVKAGAVLAARSGRGGLVVATPMVVKDQLPTLNSVLLIVNLKVLHHHHTVIVA